MNKDYILATQIRSRDAVCDHFSSRLVDVAYADYENDDAIDSVRITVESTTDLRDPKDIAWIMNILGLTMKEIDETEAGDRPLPDEKFTCHRSVIGGVSTCVESTALRRVSCDEYGFDSGEDLFLVVKSYNC